MLRSRCPFPAVFSFFFSSDFDCLLDSYNFPDPRLDFRPESRPTQLNPLLKMVHELFDTNNEWAVQ